MPEPVRAALRDGLERLGCAVEPAPRLLRYLELLSRWNRTYSLTAVRAPARMVTHHVLDSLTALPYVRGRRLLDLGTGAGVPGLILAVVEPGLDCVLLDSNAKKTRFCRHAVVDLGLSNVRVVRARAEDHRPSPRYDTVVARAFGRLPGTWRAARRLLAPGGRLVAMKGTVPAAELEELGAMGENARAVRVNVPGLDADRHLVIVSAGEAGAPGARGDEPDRGA